MKYIYKILMLGLILSVLIQTTSALREGQDYTCIDKVNVKTPLLASSVNIDKSIEKTPLCSEGKVPKTITSDIQKNIPIAIFQNESENSSPATAFCSAGKCYDFAYSYQDVGNLGARAYLTQHSPAIDPVKGIYSLANIGVGTPNANRVEVGWRKARGDVTRLYTVWWKNGVPQCYNSDCGWIQISNNYYPGMPISSNNNGVAYEIISCPLDVGCPINAGWYVYWNGELLGYYDNSLWNYNFDVASFVRYTGGVVSTVPVTTTDMGNGLWASNLYAAKIYSQQYYKETYYDEFNWINANTYKYSTSPNLYSVLATSSNSMRYGGPGSTASIIVVYPNGGEKLVRGTTKTLRWSYSGNPGSYVKIDLLKAGVLNRVITYSSPIGSSGSGYYNWLVPSTQTLGNDYKIKVTSTSNAAYTDTSNNNFIISNPYITVVSPNGGESWGRGTTHTISWSSAGSTGSYVKIDLLKAGVLNRVISSSTPNDGSFSWTVPSTQTLGTDYKIKVTSTSNAAYNDLSNNYFRIY